MSNDRFSKWNKWLDVIFSEVTTLAPNKHIFWEVQKIIKNNPNIQKPSAFYEFLGNAYAASAVIGVRRQVKIDKDSISFARLLKEISDDPTVLSRSRFVALYKGRMIGIANYEFDKFAGQGKSHVDRGIIKSHLGQLTQKAKGCEKYADKRIAHFDRKGPTSIPTFNELDDCISFLEGLLKKYWLLFRATSIANVAPVYQYDWKKIFAEPWLP